MQPEKTWCEKFSDNELVQKSLEDIECFTCLYERYEKRLVFYILRISAFSPEEAEEILQEAFVKVWENLNDFDDDLKFSSWLYRIVHNVTISEWKKSKSFGKDQKQDLEAELFENLPSLMDLEKETDIKINKKNIREILNLMSEKYREVLVLKFLEEKNYEEISDILKKPSGTVATLINRAKKEFRKISLQKQINF